MDKKYQNGRAVQKCRKLSIPSHGPIASWDYMGLSILSHSHMGLSTGCPPVPLQMHVSYCPSHPTVPWDRGTFHGMSTCPSTDACVKLSIPSHGPMGSWDIPRNVHLSLSLTHEYLTVHPIPRSHGSVK